MKKFTAKKIIYTVLEALFILIAPLTLICLEYGRMPDTTGAMGFKLGFTGVLCIIGVLLIFKRTVLKKWLTSVRDKIVNYETLYSTETDKEKLLNILRELKAVRTVECIFNAILPLLFLTAVLLLCKGLESAILQLSGVIGFTMLSFSIGTIFSILNAREIIKKEHKK